MARPRPYLHTSPPRLTGAGALPVRDADGRPLIRLQTLGAATILVGEVRLTAAAGTLFSLLLRLTGTPGMQLPRDVLRRSLWPDQADVRQRANLRQALYKLRGYGVQASMHGDVVAMDPAQVVRTFSLDRSTETFERDVTMGHEPFGTFLPGFAVPWPELQEWIDQQREAVHADVRRVLAEQLRRRRARADWGGADALARWLLQFDPLNEEATLTVAECTLLSGSKREAIAILDRYLAELGPGAGDLRLQATMLRRRIAEPAARSRLSFAPTERHFVGRETELADLTLAMRRARWHDGSAELLHGPPGIGKSRLAHELEKVAAIEGVRVAQASCRESDLLRPLSVFLDLVPELLSRPGALGSAPESLAALRRLAAPDRSVAATSGVPPMPAGGDMPGAPSPNAAEGAAMREPMPMAASLRRAIIDLLAAVSEEKPLLLVVEDVHWIDEHSWEVLSDLADRTGAMRVFLLLTSREPHARPHRPQRVPLALRVRALPPLSSESCLVLSRAIGDDLSAPVSDELGGWFVNASEGNPLFLRALVNHWIETGEAGGVPPTLQGVIEQRLSQVSGDALRVLQTAALLGKWATGERVAKVLEHSTATMMTLVGELESNAMIVKSETLHLGSHELIARVAVAELKSASRKLLHMSIARTLELELEYGASESLLLPTLLHWQSAGDTLSLVRLVLRKTSEIERTSDPIAVLRLLESISPSSLPIAEALVLGSVSSRLRVEIGLYQEELATRDGGDRLPSVGHHLTVERVESALSLVESAYRSDAAADMDKLAEFAVGVVQLDHIPRAVRVRAAGIGLVIISNQCDAERATTLWRALDISNEELRSSFDCVRVALMFHTVFGERARASQLALQLLRECNEHRRSLMTPVDAIRAGFALRLSDSGSDYLVAFKLAFDTATAIGLPAHAINAAWQLAQCNLELGLMDDYERWTRELRRLHAASSDRLSTNFAAALFCRGAIEKGDAQEAVKLFSSFIADLPESPTVKTASHRLALEMSIGLLADGWTPSQPQMRSLESYFETVARHGTADFFVSVLVEAMARTDRRKALSTLHRYETNLRREIGPWSARLRRVASAI